MESNANSIVGAATGCVPNAVGATLALNPLEHADWDSLLNTNAASCFFHTQAWCKVLHETYAHQPVYWSRLADSRLQGLLPVMEVASPWTGRRGVSLPFTDASGDLVCDAAELYEDAREYGQQRSWKYMEFRGFRPPWPKAFPSLSFRQHIVELGEGPDVAFGNLEGAVRRGIRKAGNAGLRVEFNDSPAAIRIFYSLHCGTRRRHGVPPQPLRFFENVARFVFTAKQGFVVTAKLGERAVASAVFFHWRDKAIYKFGASDYHFQHLRPNNLVMWEAIKKFSLEGFAQLDLGRTSLANVGLRRFKAGFGGREQSLDYYKYDMHHRNFVADIDRAEGRINQFFRLLPGPLFRLAGCVLYPHLS